MTTSFEMIPNREVDMLLYLSTYCPLFLRKLIIVYKKASAVLKVIVKQEYSRRLSR